MINTLGVFGGTFSPPHRGHYHAAEAFLQAINPDKLLIIPTNLPPHKSEASGVSIEDRLTMCKIAFSDLPKTEVSDMEIRRGGKSYTSVTLRDLADTARKIALLVGTDMMLTLDTWYESETVFRLADIYCIRRENDDAQTQKISEKNEYYFKAYKKRVQIIPAPVMEVASTNIRDMLSANVPEQILDTRVLAYIRERGLYVRK